MGLHDEIFNALSDELLEKVAHFGAGDIKALKKNSEELVQAFQKKISKTYGIIFICAQRRMIYRQTCAKKLKYSLSVSVCHLPVETQHTDIVYLSRRNVYKIITHSRISPRIDHVHT